MNKLMHNLIMYHEIHRLKREGFKDAPIGKHLVLDRRTIFIERFWRSLKYDYVCLFPAEDGIELCKGLKEYFHYYNNELSHQGINRQIPVTLYKPAA